MSSQTANGPEAFQCGVCNTSYSRPDHLIRHIRTHTKQRPFQCSSCSKSFARKDLLRRHVQIHDSPSSANVSENKDKHGPRAVQACRACASKKLKCSDEKPCRRCISKDISCDYEQTSTYHVDQSSSSHPTPSFRYEAAFQSPSDATQSSEPAGAGYNMRPCQTEADLTAVSMSQGLIDPAHLTPPDIWGIASDLPNFGDYIQMDGFVDLGDPDLPFLQGVNAFSAANGTHRSVLLDDSPGMGLGSDAYRDSDLQKGWTPGAEDSVRSASLKMPSIAQTDVLSASARKSPNAIKDQLTIKTRDKILAMLYEVTHRDVWNRLCMTFASMELLKNIVQYAILHMQEHQIIPFIHIPSFDINAQRPELLGALIAYGAVCGRTSSIRSFGYGLQMLVGMAVQKRLADEHASLRDFGMSKAFYILLHIGLWSGMSAKIEMAELNASLGATMLRRGKFLQEDSYRTSPQSPSAETAQSLEDVWAEWAEAESRKRLVYFAMLLDAEISITRNINPLLAYSEIQTPLPGSNELWKAASAQQWHDTLMRNSKLRESARPINILLRQPALLKDQLKVADQAVMSAAFMAGFSALVREYRQMESLLAEIQDNNDFVQKSRHTELRCLLDQWKMEVEEVESEPIEVMILHELLFLHLNVSYYDISAYSGRGTMREAAAAKVYVQRWFHSEVSRHAIFHCGQIIRLSRHLRPGRLRDISVIALYQATETMWVWGLIQRAQSTPGTTQNPPLVALDAEESTTMNKFLRVGRGKPGVTGPDGQFVPLNEPAAVANLSHAILQANLGDQLYPLNTGEVSRILHGFSRIARSSF